VRAAQESLLRLPRGSSGWHAAFGHLVIAYGYLGRKDRLLARVDELSAVEEEEGVKTEGHLVSACRLGIFLIRAGVPQLGRRLVREAHHHAAGQNGVGPFLRAWLATARAELGLLDGDPTAYLRRVEAAVDAFTEASDVRNACLQRTNVGHAYMLLGAYDRARFVLERAAAVAEPMQLDFVPIAKAHLGFCMAQLGQWEEGVRTVDAAIVPCRKRNDKRRLSVLLIVSARLRAMQGNHVAAAALSRAAAEDAEESPAQRAQALGSLADALLAEGSVQPALAAASEAASIADRLGGLDEGEALVRLAHALALHAAGQEAEARRRLGDAKKKLVAMADRIKDRRFRKSFLENVSEHRRLLEAAADWGV
jgi:tetratricopeptide (TPR) repeat protein